MKRNWYNWFDEYARALEATMAESVAGTVAEEFRTTFGDPSAAPTTLWAIGPDGRIFSPAATVRVGDIC